MAGYWTDLFSFTTGAVRNRGFAYLVITDDEMREKKMPHFSLIVWQEGKWGDAGRFTWNCTTTIVVHKPKEQALAVGEFGDVLLLGSGDKHEEKISAPDSNPEDRGPLRCARFVGSRAYVAGMDRQVYRRDGVNRWTAVDAGTRPPEGSNDVVGFEGIDGFSEKEIYAAGWEGEIWMYNGLRWKQLHSPTNMILTNLCCGDDIVYACGRGGLLIEGRGDKWRVIEQDVTDDDIWGLAWYNGELYLATLGAVYRIHGDRLELVEMGDDEPETCYHLSTADGVLWSIGAKDVFAFDGAKWRRID
jgi:hypothetical protein